MSRAARVLPARCPVPVLGGLLLVVGASGRLRFSGLDFEASARVETRVRAVRAGKVVLPALL